MPIAAKTHEAQPMGANVIIPTMKNVDCHFFCFLLFGAIFFRIG
jgi:hypothetical protein